MLKGVAVEPNRIILSAAIQQHLETLSLKSEASTIYSYQVIARHIEAHKLGKKLYKKLSRLIYRHICSTYRNKRGCHPTPL